MFIYFHFWTLTICISLQHCTHDMTFVMSLFFWSFCECNVYGYLYCLFHFCILSTLLALAMLAYVSHANKAFELNWIERGGQWEGERNSERERERKSEIKIWSLPLSLFQVCPPPPLWDTGSPGQSWSHLVPEAWLLTSHLASTPQH